VKNTLTAQQAKAIWISILMENFLSEFQKLYHIQFIKDGRIKENNNYKYVKKHFPNLLRIWEEKIKENK